ncbi:hypothetical protein GF325_10565, partial [Candidatus Bathyarchaeota archaeon]|nr:hypothetical protein [Candidatus Bathyarchaeota archaeon]
MMNLGDAFTRRKQINSEIQTWLNRLQLAGRDSEQFKTNAIEGEEKFKPVPGSYRKFTRNYTIEECMEKLEDLMASDRKLALRISMTNHVARATLLDLDGTEMEYSIPELLVLKNEIA